MHAAPTSSKSLLASYFKSEPTEIHLCKNVRNLRSHYTQKDNTKHKTQFSTNSAFLYRVHYYNCYIVTSFQVSQSQSYLNRKL